MPVNKRTYKSYSGPRTATWSRFAVITRFGFSDVMSSRITSVLFLLCMSPTVIALVVIYIMNSDTARLLMGLGNRPLLPIDERFFYIILRNQCWLALILTAWVGPRLMSVDLSNNALPIVLSRPISRAEYILGKLTVLWLMFSAVTWAPMLLIFAFQARMSVQPWAGKNLFIAYGAVAGALAWMVVLSLLALALSSWVKWRMVATASIFGVLFMGAGIGSMYNVILHTNRGTLIDVPSMITTLWERLLHITPMQFYRRPELLAPSSAVIVFALLAIVAACAFALNARIRGREVVRG